jgi:hypothetical protein
MDSLEQKDGGLMTGDGHTRGRTGSDPSLAHAVGRVTSILAIPYGYTVTLSVAALTTVARLGVPSELEVLLFALGAVLGFVLLAIVGFPHLDAEVPMRVPSLVVFNLFPVLTTVAVILLPSRHLGKSLGYFASSFIGTALYVLLLAVLVRVRARVRGGAT